MPGVERVILIGRDIVDLKTPRGSRYTKSRMGEDDEIGRATKARHAAAHREDAAALKLLAPRLSGAQRLDEALATDIREHRPIGAVLQEKIVANDGRHKPRCESAITDKKIDLRRLPRRQRAEEALTIAGERDEDIHEPLITLEDRAMIRFADRRATLGGIVRITEFQRALGQRRPLDKDDAPNDAPKRRAFRRSAV